MEFDSSSDEGEIDDDSYHSSDDEPIIKQQASKPVIPPLPSFPLFNCNPNKKRRTDSTEITESTSTLFTSNNRNTHNKNKKKQSPPQVITKKKNKKKKNDQKSDKTEEKKKKHKSKKKKNVPKKLGKSAVKGGVKVHSESNVGRWINHMKTDPKLMGEFEHTRLKAATPKDKRDKNYWCPDCACFHKATCRSDLIKHERSATHKRKKAANKKANGGEQVTITSISERINEVTYDYMNSCYRLNMHGTQAVGMVNEFISKHQPRFGQNLPKNENAFMTNGDWMNGQYKSKVKTTFLKFKENDGAYFHWCYQSDEGAAKKLGMLPGLISMNGTMKPIIGRIDCLATSSNAMSVQNNFIRLERDMDLGFDWCILWITDSVSYNKSAAQAIILLCPYMMVIFCPLHKLCNSIHYTLEGTVLGKLMLEVFKNTTALFKNSRERKASWAQYTRQMESLHLDPLVLDLIKSCTPFEFCEAYNLDRGSVDLGALEEELKRKQTENLVDDLINMEHEHKSGSLEVDVVTPEYIKATKRKQSPKYIHNKWKTSVFCCFWQIMNFSGFIGWTHGHFQDETYFTKLRAKKIRLIKLAMALFFYILRDYLFIVLRVEKRKPIHNLLYDLIKQYMDNVKAMKVNVSIESLNNKELCHAQHIYDTWDIMAKKEKESVMDDIHEFTERLGCELDKRFKDSDDSMKFWKACKMLDIRHREHPNDMMQGIGFLKLVSKYKNDRALFNKIKQEYLHLRTVMAAEYHRLNVEQYKGVDWTRVKKGQWSVKALVAKYKLDGDLIAMFKNCGHYEILDKIAVVHLDNPNSDVDSERAMNYLSMIEDCKYSTQLEGANLSCRLLSMFEKR
eukprot:928087_1